MTNPWKTLCNSVLFKDSLASISEIYALVCCLIRFICAKLILSFKFINQKVMSTQNPYRTLLHHYSYL